MSQPLPESDADLQTCGHRGWAALQWVKCKLVCRNCRQMVRSCADVVAE